MEPLRVIIAEDSMLMREGIRQVIDRERDLTVVAVCADVLELEQVIAQDPPDVLVTDVRMPPGFSDEGIQVAVELRSTHPGIGVVVLSQYAEPAYANSLLSGGSAGRAYLLKERISEPGQLVDAIRTVAQGGSVVDPTIIDLLVSGSGRIPSSPLSLLTPRELQVLDQVAQGKSNAGAAASLALTERAVEKHINALFAKLGLGVAPDLNRRVTAVLLHLSAKHGPEQQKGG